MDKLIANASISLAKASMNRRGFLGRLARAAGGAAVLTAGFATVARADHCGGSHFCETARSNEDGFCGDSHCVFPKKARYWRQEGNDCYTGANCPAIYSFRDCEAEC